MSSTNIVLRALKWSVSLMLLGSLGGCHWDLFGSDAGDSAQDAAAATYTVGGTVAGLASGAMFTLLDNGADSLSIAANGAFIFTTALPANAGYAVTAGTEPTGQTCTVTGAMGTISTANVTGVTVTCADQTFTLGGTIQGLSGSGLVLANGSATVTVPSGAQSFTLPSTVAYGSSYSVTIQSQPAGFACVVNAGGGTMPANAVTSVVVSCTVQTYTVGGTISGLGANTGLVLANGTDTIVVAANATQFTMPASIANGALYNVTIAGKPRVTTCAVTNGSGTIAAANVTNIAVNCRTWVESVVYSFAGPPGDGALAYGNLLLAKDGNFYGMNLEGGTFNGAGGIGIDGTVFKLTPAGAESVLWSFGGANDGEGPFGSLIQGSDGNVYGMTAYGGLYGSGTVFRMTPARVESVLWSFGNSNDGAVPWGSLVEGSDGNFYGVTSESNGPTFDGTVFKITPAGVETVLWTFGNGNDGQTPYGGLVEASDGSFYGMTNGGGVNGKGVIFRITPAGAETVIWSFGANGDGAQPSGSLTLGSDGDFYGMTFAGGAYGAGTVFKVTRSGAEAVIYSFNGPDGANPAGTLLLGPDGNFYGMTHFGGDNNFGTIFQMTPGGALTQLWSFADAYPDGDEPYGDLILGPDGGLYGMTDGGGTAGFGAIITIK